MLDGINDISISEYDYSLPDDKIAKFPKENRSDSKLLISKRAGFLTDCKLSDIGDYLPFDSLLIFNKTKVLHARLHFKKATGGAIEIFCLEPAGEEDPQVILQSSNTCTWKCLVRGAKKWKGEPLTLELGELVLVASLKNRLDDSFEICFEWGEGPSFAEILLMAGEIPLPPYLNRKAEASDKKAYQTIFAQNEGSVAAPTAGLHFTKELMESFPSKGVSMDFITLHVGAGTFKPVQSEKIIDHHMHAELIDVSINTLFNIIDAFGPIIPVGTTSLRTLESLYWFGVQAHQGELHNARPELDQWYPYQDHPNLSLKESLRALLSHLDKQGKTRLVAKTQLMIAPGYKFKVARGLVTNFHQPKSTLLLIIAAMIGDNWKKMYEHALKHNFRFLSYGDCCFLLP